MNTYKGNSQLNHDIELKEDTKDTFLQLSQMVMGHLESLQ